MPQIPSSWAANPFSDSDTWEIFQVYWGPEPPPRQNSTGALITIDYPHHELHDGAYYIASHIRADTDALADNATYDMTIRPSTAGDDLHSSLMVSIGGDAEAYLYEGVNADTDGTDVTVVNANRSSTDASAVQIQIDPTVNSVGTAIMARFLPGGSGPASGGQTARSGIEIILSKEQVYMIRAINRAGTAQPASLHAEWYEHSE